MESRKSLGWLIWSSSICILSSLLSVAPTFKDFSPLHRILLGPSWVGIGVGDKPWGKYISEVPKELLVPTLAMLI